MNAPSRKTGCKKTDRSHGYDQAGLFAGLLEVANDCIALVGSGVDGDKVVVVEIHPRRLLATTCGQFRREKSAGGQSREKDRARGCLRSKVQR